MHSFPITKR